MEIADLGQRIGGSGRPFIGPSGEIAGSVTDHISIHAPLSACVRLVNILGIPALLPRRPPSLTLNSSTTHSMITIERALILIAIPPLSYA